MINFVNSSYWNNFAQFWNIIKCKSHLFRFTSHEINLILFTETLSLVSLKLKTENWPKVETVHLQLIIYFCTYFLKSFNSIMTFNNAKMKSKNFFTIEFATRIYSIYLDFSCVQTFSLFLFFFKHSFKHESNMDYLGQHLFILASLSLLFINNFSSLVFNFHWFVHFKGEDKLCSSRISIGLLLISYFEIFSCKTYLLVCTISTELWTFMPQALTFPLLFNFINLNWWWKTQTLFTLCANKLCLKGKHQARTRNCYYLWNVKVHL